MVDLFLNGFVSVLNLETLLIILIGVALGLVFGAIPGLTAVMAIAICLPITFGMEPLNGMALLLGLYIGGVSGGFIPAMLLNIPGTPSSIATTFDGYPMAQNGEAGKAFTLTIIFSFLAGLLSFAILIFVSPLLASIAIEFSPFEYFAVTIFALTMITSLSGNSMLKGVLAGCLGIVLAMIGMAPIDSYPRFTFGFSDLDAGLDVLPVLIGLFAISEILKAAENKDDQNKKRIEIAYKLRDIGISFREVFQQKWNWLRSTLIGVGVGILPGLGGSTANIIAYATAKNQSKTPEKFGKGTPYGVVATESSNNASIGGALVPLLSIGIPGDGVTALLIGGLMLHGLNPGPLLFEQHGDVMYGIFAALLIANAFMALLLIIGMRFFIRILNVPQHLLLPIIIVLCVVGAFGVNNRLFDAVILVACGLLGYVLIKLKIPIMPVVLAFILAPILELNLRRGLMHSNGDWTPFITSPIAFVFLTVALISVIVAVRNNMKRRRIVGDQ
ncbi:tripartite tricarboxylate transporter permease [Geomicrobium sediminis]|uniref:Tricarboxylic transport membrane protein n=1 Tax=Geomicrobium sediminis TaxID=1347788 RepID=A0ABS2PA10_9BACL|nr:tripartite tricarboxylate transporter permease [Geomicrobium sediminis]MBM7632244.1 putative tricarboxylic transport membrane protein [Geomicrobium sediminis]